MGWTEEQVQRCMPLSLLVIQAQARRLSNMLKEHTDGSYTHMFATSLGGSCASKRVSGGAVTAGIECAEAFKEEFLG